MPLSSACIISLRRTQLCEKCEGDLFGKPVIGMEVINGLSLKKIYLAEVARCLTRRLAAPTKAGSGSKVMRTYGAWLPGLCLSDQDLGSGSL